MLGTITAKKEETPQKVAISLATASSISDLSQPFLRNEVRAGKIPVVRPGGSRAVRIMMDDFLNYLRGGESEK